MAGYIGILVILEKIEKEFKLIKRIQESPLFHLFNPNNFLKRDTRRIDIGKTTAKAVLYTTQTFSSQFI